MDERKQKRIILIAEDDSEDQLLFEEAWEESKVDINLFFVNDGEELIQYLQHGDQFPGSQCIILLDLNMPRKDGREALKEIKMNESFKNIPIVVFTTSKSTDDIAKCYGLGASSYIVKPSTFDELVELVKSLHNYWFNTVKLLPNRK